MTPSPSRLDTWGPPALGAVVGAVVAFLLGVGTNVVVLPGERSTEAIRLDGLADSLAVRVEMLERDARRREARTGALLAELAVLDDSVRGLLARLPAPRASGRARKTNGFEVSFGPCTRSGADVSCDLHMVNTEPPDRALVAYAYQFLGGRSTVITDGGATVKATRIALGSASPSGSVRVTLPQHRPLQGAVTFGGVERSARAFTVATLLLGSDEAGAFEARFEDIPIEG